MENRFLRNISLQKLNQHMHSPLEPSTLNGNPHFFDVKRATLDHKEKILDIQLNVTHCARNRSNLKKFDAKSQRHGPCPT